MPKLAPAASEAMYVRAPVGLKDKLKAAAAKHGRTLNAETVRRLEQSLEEKP